MAAAMSPYELWLSEKLVSLNPDVDGEVFVNYISGILDTDTDNEEKKESLEDIIAQIVEEGTGDICNEIIAKWKEMVKNTSSNEGKVSVDEQLSKILSSQKLSVADKGRELSAEEKARKAAILRQYGDVCEGPGSDSSSEEETIGATSGGDLNYMLSRNTNKEEVDKNQREMREKAKKESENKKQKDKMDREAQKAKSQDRKDAEKKRTQKGERRR